MANEISITTGLQVSNGTSQRPGNQRTVLADQSAVGIGEATVDITTSDASFNLPQSSPGWVQLRNDGANPIKWGPDNGSGVIAVAGQISPGMTTQLEFPSTATAIRAQTTTGTSKLSILAIKR